MKRALYHPAARKAIARASQAAGKPMILETERLSLRPLEVSDAELLFPILSDPEVMAHWDVPETDDPDAVRITVEAQVAAMADGRALYWTIWTLEEAEFLGACDLSEIDRWHKRAEVGFILGRDAWGQGYALEAMRAVVAYAASTGFKRLAARTHLGNHRSDALLGKLGFVEEGRLRGHVERDGERRDCRLFGLLL
jgi:[ribosomal protein S5]-alanine N-acetyltransferase